MGSPPRARAEAVAADSRLVAPDTPPIHVLERAHKAHSCDVSGSHTDRMAPLDRQQDLARARVPGKQSVQPDVLSAAIAAACN